MTRHRFLQSLLTASVWCAGLAFAGWPILRFVTWRRQEVRKVVFAAHELAPFVSREGVILVPNGQSLLALSEKCTHLGCRVSYQETRQEFVCPCHKSAYNLQGKRLRGPAGSDLPVLESSELANGDLVVALPIRG